jgi:twitching motility protein PilT
MYTLDHQVPHQPAPIEPNGPGPGDLAVLNQMLVTLVESRGSDLHLTVGTPPMIRVNGSLRPIPGYGNLNSADTALLARAAVSPEQWETFENCQELDFAHSIVGVSRFRGNLYIQRNSCGAVFRAIPHEIKPLDELGMPDSVARFAHLPRGLVLVTGPTGSGKTTTLASIRPTAAGPTTSSRSRTRSSSCTRTSAAWSTSVRWAPTPRTSPARSSTRSGRTRTSSWSVSSATWRRRRPR